LKRLLQFEKGETIIREGDVGESAYMIQDGRVEVSRSTGDRKVVLASLGKGEIFGEMSLIDDSPRGATITATTDTSVVELPGEEFLEHLQNEPEFATRVLRTIFERLRDANIRVQQLEQNQPAVAAEKVDAEEADSGEAPPADRQVTVTLEGLTPRAKSALPSNPYRVESFPLLIGRASGNALVNNDLGIADTVPWQVSRHHVKLVVENGRVAAVDRGSRLGSSVDGQALGGRSGRPGPVVFEEPEGLLVLGVAKSPYRYKVSITEA